MPKLTSKLPFVPQGNGPGLRDLAVALVFLASIVGLYSATFQLRSYGDGDALGAIFVRDVEGDATWLHPAYFASARALARVTPSVGLADPLRRLSVWSGAVGVAATFLFLRRMGTGFAASVGASALLAVTPAVWFFSTTIEVHAPHFAAVACPASTSRIRACAKRATWSCSASRSPERRRAIPAVRSSSRSSRSA